MGKKESEVVEEKSEEKEAAEAAAAGIYSGMIKAGNWTPGKKGVVKPAAFLKWVAPKRLKDFGNLRPVIEIRVLIHHMIG